MPPLTDPVILAAFRSALSNWNFTDYVTEKDAVMAWRDRELPGTSLKAVAKRLYDHLQVGGTIDQTPETRPEWNDRPFHYDFRIMIANRRLYIETILVDDDPTDPYVHIVSMHDA
jgi:hypothetical protein